MLHLVKVESEGVSHWIVSNTLRPNGLYSPWNSPGQNNEVDNQLRDWTQLFHIAGGFFTSWATREDQEYWSG